MTIKFTNKINYLWRIIATAISFITFGMGGLLMSLTIFPPLFLLIHDKIHRENMAQRIIHFSFSFHIGMMKFLGIMTTEIIHAERFQTGKGQLILANHPTLIDVVFILSIIPKSYCIVKQSLFKNIFLKGVVSSAGYISNGLTTEQLLGSCLSIIKDGHNLVIFPEGTRTEPGEKLKFQRSPSRLAIMGNMVITPLVISCYPSTLTKQNKWYQIPATPFHIKMKVGEPILASNIVDTTLAPSLTARSLTHYLEDFFQQEVVQNEQA